MTDEEISARELAGFLRSIDDRLAKIEQGIGRMERERSHVQKEKYEGKRRFKNRQKSARSPGETLQRITEAEIACEQALKDARQHEQETREELDRLRQNATKTTDGRSVFLSADGARAVDDQGNELTAAEIAATEWKQGATTLEQWQEGNERLEQARQKTQEIEDYQERLQEGRERIEGGERLTTDELKGIEDNLEAVPDSVREHLSEFKTPSASRETRASAAKEYEEGQGIEAAAITPAFARAVLGLEEIADIKNSPATAPKPS